jgi:hypothetical protein
LLPSIHPMYRAMCVACAPSPAAVQPSMPAVCRRHGRVAPACGCRRSRSGRLPPHAPPAPLTLLSQRRRPQGSNSSDGRGPLGARSLRMRRVELHAHPVWTTAALCLLPLHALPTLQRRAVCAYHASALRRCAVASFSASAASTSLVRASAER